MAGRRFRAGVARQVAADPRVARSASEVLDEARIVGKGGKVAGSGPYFGIGYDFSRPGASRLTPFRLAGGRWPSAPGEVVIDQGTADAHDLHPGVVAHIAGSGAAQRFRVVGVATFGTVKSLGTATVAIFTVPEAQALFGRPGRVDTVLVAARPGVAPAALRAGLAASLPAGTRVRSAQAQDRFTLDGLRHFIGIIRTILLILGGVAVLVGALTIANALSMAVAQQSRSLALLRSVGASRRQVRRLVLFEALPLGIVGSAVGIAVGYALAAGLSKLFAALGMVLPATSQQLSGATVAAGLLIGVGVPFAAALRPARRATRIAPVAALREAQGAAEPGRVGRVVRLAASVLGRPAARFGGVAGTLARRNTMRLPGRTGSTAAALTIGVAIVTLVAVMVGGLRGAAEGSVAREARADYVVASSDDGSGATSASALRAVAAVPGVRRVGALAQQPGRVLGRTVTVDGLRGSAPAMLHYEVTSGAPEAARSLAPGQALVRADFARSHHLKVGDGFTVAAPDGGRLAVTAVAIVRHGSLDPLALGEVTLSGAQFGQAFTALQDRFGLVDVAGGARPAQRAAIMRALGAFPGAYVETPSTWGRDLASFLDQLLAIVVVLLALAIVVSLLGMVNTLALGVVERRRELGLLRAAGMTRRQVRRMVRWESVLTALLGAGAGIVAGLGVAAALTAALSGDGMTFHAPAGMLIAVSVVAVAAGVMAAVLPARRASRVDVLQAVTVE